MADLLCRLIGFAGWILSAYMWVVIAAALITWVSPDPRNPVVRFLFNVTEPVFYRIRRVIPTNIGGFDVAPLLTLVAIVFIQNVLIGWVQSLVGCGQILVR